MLEFSTYIFPLGFYSKIPEKMEIIFFWKRGIYGCIALKGKGVIMPIYTIYI